MSYRIFGALLILSGCGGFGISLASQHKRQERLLGQLGEILNEMIWELPFQLTPLPELLRHAVSGKKGSLPAIFQELAHQLDRQVLPDAASCMNAALEQEELPEATKSLLRLLGQSLGRFDLTGQLNGLNAVKQRCEQELRRLQGSRDIRLKSYRVLCLCAGAALVILLL